MIKAHDKTLYNPVETPNSAVQGVLKQLKTRSKNIINTVAYLTLSINYEKVLRIETDIANAAVQKKFEK